MDNPQMFDLMPPLLRNKKDVLFGNMAEIYEFHNKYVIAKLKFLVILFFFSKSVIVECDGAHL